MTNLYFARWTVLQATPNTGITIQCCFVRDPDAIPVAILEKHFRVTRQEDTYGGKDGGVSDPGSNKRAKTGHPGNATGSSNATSPSTPQT